MIKDAEYQLAVVNGTAPLVDSRLALFTPGECGGRNWMRRVAFLSALALVASCSDHGAPAPHPEIPPELAELKENVIRCMRDVDWTHAERSEHCVIAAEGYLDSVREDCESSQSNECLNYGLAHLDIYSGYKGAIIQSLLDHGKSEEVEKLGTGDLWFLIYLDGEVMRGLFEQCLAREEAALKDAGLIRVNTIMSQPLEEGQLCFRKGYPEFRTRPALES